jgi:hypothetical protein
MTFIANYKNIIYSICIIAIWTSIVFFLAYPDKSGLGSFFSVSIYFIFTLFAGIGLGFIALCFRLLRLIKKQSSNFFYVFAGVLNLILGVIGSLLEAFNGNTDFNYLRLFLVSGLLGLIIIFDIFFIKEAPH